MATTQPVRGSRRAVRWAVLAPRVALVEGLRADTTTKRFAPVGLGQYFEGLLVAAGHGAGRSRWPVSPGSSGRGEG